MKKRIFLAVLVLFGSIGITIAQGGGGGRQMDPEQRAKATVDRLKPELSLSEQQEKDLTPIYAEYFGSMRKMMESGARPSQEDRQKMTEERDEKLKKVLSEDQMKKLAAYEEKMRQERRQGGGGGNN